ncbi:MAG: mannose-1-phosphate guanylyltransferase [Solitalea-like symbiont of Tyrophagus putrescentiae]
MDKNNNYVVIMAGGVGSRLWPVSTQSHPKQFIDILQTGETLLQYNYNKYLNFCKKDNIYVITTANYKDLIQNQLNSIPQANILYEPLGRNTAICIAYAAYKIALKNSEANIIVTPSDQLLTNDEKFVSTMATALDFSASNNYIVTIGIKPSSSYTEYGYIQYEPKNPLGENIYKIKTFTEKPSQKLAKQFLLSEEFLWNSGIFICKANNLINTFGKHLSMVSHLFWQAAESLNTPKEEEEIKKVYSQCPSISIDYGLMEKADNISTIIAEFNWIDLGSWHAIYNSVKQRDSNNNVIIGSNNVKLTNVTNCLVYNTQKNKQLSINNINNRIIINTDESLLITDYIKNK